MIVGTRAQWARQETAVVPSDSRQNEVMMDAEYVRSMLPWRQPFQMIDRLVECFPHETITTLKEVSGNDAMRLEGSPGPVSFPAALVLEGMGQSASLLYQLSYGRMTPSKVPLLGYMKATHHGSARPGEAITFVVRAVKMTTTMGLFEATASVQGRAIAQAEFAMGVGGGERTEPTANES